MWQKIKNFYHLLQSIAALIRYGFPANSLTVIGVTGTDGKTTTSHLIAHILRELKFSVASITTLGAHLDDRLIDTGFHVSTPGSFQLQSYLALAKKRKIQYVVLETTSHALDQNRVFGIHFAVGVLTNVTHEHLDYHKSFASYLASKIKLLHMSNIAVVNRDDNSYKKFSSLKKALSKSQWVTFGLLPEADINPKNFHFQTTLPGTFNTYNILAATACAKALGVSEHEIQKAIRTFKPLTGRAEVLYNNDFSVIVDFAHTPNGLEQILKTLGKDKKGRLIHVFGSAGERDQAKRPMMGEVSSKYADVIVLTSEDPRTEDPSKIVEEIASGIIPLGNSPLILKNTDREQAIREAVALSKPHDIVVITGKGHEKSMNMGTGEIPWSDQEAVRKALKVRDEKSR